MAARARESVFIVLWSYVKGDFRFGVYIVSPDSYALSLKQHLATHSHLLALTDVAVCLM
jgi:hypothetical protein